MTVPYKIFTHTFIVCIVLSQFPPLSLASVQGTLNTFELKLICRDDERVNKQLSGKTLDKILKLRIFYCQFENPYLDGSWSSR